MKDIDNIEDWYREELNNYNVEPDKNVWNSLSEELDLNTPLTDENISEWYKKEASKLKERPDYTVWEKLSTKLDTTSVWDRLATSLNRYEQIIWWRNLAFRGTAIFLLFLGSYLAYNNYSNNENVIATNTEKNYSIEKSTNNNKIFPATNNVGSSNLKQKTNSTNENNKAIKNSELTNSSNHTSLSPEDEIKIAIEKSKANLINNSSPTSNRERTTYASKEDITLYSFISVENLNSLKTKDERSIFTDINRHQLTERDISHLYASGEFLVKKDRNKIVFNSKRFSAYSMFGIYARRIYAGFNVGLKKQGMITKLKKNSLLAGYTQNNFLDFGTNFGGTVGFIVSDNFNLEANLNLNSTAGYKRAFNSEGVSYKENLNLNYTNISILAKKMNNKSTFDNKVFSTNLIGGIYASYLRSAVSDANGVSRSLDEYNNTDFGIILGIEQDRYISKTLVITPGIRYNQGLTNIANNNSSFESARNFSFEFNLGIKYIFLKKGK
ncbi:MAG: hypothetical protein JKX68_11190 [Flavobacteriales bacterium]|nr:hypothetical protein [Flavobacteriales bacterium]